MLLPCFGQKPTPKLSQTDLVRIETKKKWISAAKQIYLKTQDEEVKMVIDLILDNMITAKPMPPNNMQVLEGAKANSPWTALMPVIREDVQMAHMKKFLENKNVFASYGPENRVITVRDLEPCSEFWKGIMLLHEAHHAGDLIFQPYDWKNPQLFSEMEKNVHNFQNRLTSKIGGLIYDTILLKEINRIRIDLKKLGIDGMRRQKGAFTNITIPSRTDYYPELDKALTPALSQLEKDARQTAFWIHAVFKMYETDRGQGSDAESGKTTFLHVLYVQGGMFKD